MFLRVLCTKLSRMFLLHLKEIRELSVKMADVSRTFLRRGNRLLPLNSYDKIPLVLSFHPFNYKVRDITSRNCYNKNDFFMRKSFKVNGEINQTKVEWLPWANKESTGATSLAQDVREHICFSCEKGAVAWQMSKV